MPRLNPNFSRCVFFLYGRDQEGRIKSAPDGSGVLIGVRDVVPKVGFVTSMYAVSCAHVVSQGASVMRINTADGGSRFIELDADVDWRTPKNGADVAAAEITELLKEGDEVRYLSPAWLASREFVAGAGIGIGDDGFMLGLFSDQAGKDRNLVAAKFGNISLMADDSALVQHEKLRPARPAHLFDIRSRGGFSGSPVFVFRTPGGDLRDVDAGGEGGMGSQRRRTTLAPRLSETRGDDLRRYDADAVEWAIEHDTDDNLFIRLLGIHVAQYSEVVRVRRRPENKARVEVEEDVIRSGDQLVIEGGVTVVVPAWEIIDLLSRPEFVQKREDRNSEQDEQATTPAAEDEPTSS